MKKVGYLTLLLLLWVGVAQATPLLIPAAPQIAARGYILIDYHSGRVLAEKDADKRMPPASLTKLMTAYVVFHELKAGHIHMDDMVTVSKKAWKTGGSRMFLEVGTKVSVRDLLIGMLVDSGNDAAVALSQYVAGGEDSFTSLMNEYAHKLGMTNTHYVNATGLTNSPDHYTTPRDLTLLATAIIRQFPEYYHFFSIKKFTYDHITQNNWNILLFRDPNVDGMKTGHTEAAGYCLVASAKEGKMRLISAVMGTDSENARASQSQKLLNYGFRFYETHKLYAAGAPLKTMRVWKGERENLTLGLAKPLYVTVPRGGYKQLKATMTVPATLEAPVSKGSKLGTVNIKLDGSMLAQRPLVALQSIPEGGIMRRMVDSVMLLLH